MDLIGPQTLDTILQPDELELVPDGIQKKLSAYIKKFSDEYCKERAAANRLHESEQKTEELQNQIQDFQVKFNSFEQNVAELRTQLDQVSAERTQLLDTVNNYDLTVSSLRKEKNGIVDERDSLLKVIERQNGEIERLKNDLHTYQQQLNSAITLKCEAIARVDEIQSKEIALDLKEQRLETKCKMLQTEVQLLSSDLNRTNAELQNMRRDNSLNSMHLEVRLKEKTDELQIVQSQNAQYAKSLEEMNKKVEQLNDTMYQHNMGTEKYITTLKKELDTKEKLIEIYKNTENENVVERNELLTGISDLKRMLHEATEHHGVLETNFLAAKEKHADEVNQLNNTIDALKMEVKHANNLLKEVQEQNLESAICKLAPTAAVASRLIKSDMSLTELYSLYIKTSEELEAVKCANSQLNLHMKSILEEVTEQAPVLEKQAIDYSKLVEAHDILVQQNRELENNNRKLEHELDTARFDVAHACKENKKLKQCQTDLSRQVCMLLHEINLSRAGVDPPRNQSHSGLVCSSSDAISKELVTFTSIVEMEEKYTKMLALVRDLSSELESNENNNHQFKIKTLEEKLEQSARKLLEMEEILSQKDTSMTTLIAKCDRYKNYYFEAQKKLGCKIIDLDNSTILIDESAADNSISAANIIKQDAEAKLERRIKSLEQQLEDENKRYAALKESYDYYTNEKRKNDAMLQEQCDTMRKEIRELTSVNCKLTNASEFQKEQTELLHKTIHTYKQQIAALEDRTKNYEKTIIKHEQTVLMLKEDVMNVHRKQAASDAEAHSLRHENRVLKDTTARLQAEKESFHREQQSQALLLNNLEFIKANLERSETEGRLRLEQRLDDTVRELSAQRRHFQEEEEKFRETVNEYKRQTETAKKLMEEEKQQANKLHDELIAVREELSSKVKQMNDLSKKLQDSLTPSKNENPIAAANKKAREFELKFDQAKIEIDSLRNDLAKVREHSDQFYKMSQSAETEIKRLHDIHADIVAKSEEEIKQLKKSEAELKTRVTDLEAEVMLSSVTEQSKSTNQSDQLKLAQEELKNVLEKLTESGRTIRTLRAENSTLVESLNVAERKYANEMVLHSSDIQELSKLKTEFLKVNDELNNLRIGREALQVAHDEMKKANEEIQKVLQTEKDQFDERVADLNALNASLHDQIEALTAKLASITQTDGANQSGLLHDSIADASMTELNTSALGDEVKSNELLQIIKFLRKEKDLYAAKLDIVKAENARVVSEHTILQKKIDELNGYLNQERSKSETDVVSASKHEEVLRKIETLNAITDSNRILRDERNTLTERVAELTERISSIEQELFPLQCKNKELTSKIEEITVENTSLRTEAIKWRQRANALVEKSNRNPEEFKRLQMERENLAKMLTAEKEMQKKQSDEVTALKSRIETELPVLNKHLQLLGEDRKKLNDEATNLKQNNARMAQEIMELKNRLLQKEEAVLKASEELEQKDKQMQDKDTKELQLRKLAKRYKDYYMQAQSGGTEASGELDKLRSELEEVKNTLQNTKEEHDKLLKENDELKSRCSLENDTAVLRESKQKIEKLVNELTVTKTELANQESTFAGIKSSYDATIARLEKELQEHITANKDINARLSRETESLHIRINQLTRQLGSQQSSKPATSSVGITEKGNISESSPRTANVKPMSGSATVQQSATVTPWRGSETPLASIRPISVQNSRTAAILPTSQQPSAGNASTSTSTSTSSGPATGSSSTVANTALVPPQQQVHTTGSGTLESMASSSPTSSHTDYMPSTSSASVAVAAIPPMGATSAAESSQEAESIQHPQQNDAQLFSSGAQQQVVALVSPRVEGSSSTSTTSTQNPAMPIVQVSQDTSSQQPSTSGGTSSSSIVVSSHSRHTPSSSNVTTTQAGCSSINIKRPRDVEGDSTNAEEGVPEKIARLTKRIRTPMHAGELLTGHIGDSGMDVDQMPTSSQRDQEDDIVVVDSEEEEEDVLADDGPMDAGDGEQEGYEDSYEQDNEIDDNEGADEADDMPTDGQGNNEVDFDADQEPQDENESPLLEAVDVTISTQENNQQSQAISSGSGESNSSNTMPQAEAAWKQAPSTSTSAGRRSDSSVEIVSSPQVSNIAFGDHSARVEPEVDGSALDGADRTNESAGTSADYSADNSSQKALENDETHAADANKTTDEIRAPAESVNEADDAFAEEMPGPEDDPQQLGNETQNVGTSQSELSDDQPNHGDAPSEENEGADGVSSEGEKQAVEGVEEEGREAEASTSPSENTRSRTLRSTIPTRRNIRSGMRGSNNRPTPIIWQGDSPQRNHPNNLRNQDQMMPGAPMNNRMFANRSRGRRPMRRPPPNNYNNGGRYQ